MIIRKVKTKKTLSKFKIEYRNNIILLFVLSLFMVIGIIEGVNTNDDMLAGSAFVGFIISSSISLLGYLTYRQFDSSYVEIDDRTFFEIVAGDLN